MPWRSRRPCRSFYVVIARVSCLLTSAIFDALALFFSPQINGKHLDKIIGSSVDKVTKKSGDKLKLHVTRTILAMPKNCELKVGMSCCLFNVHDQWIDKQWTELEARPIPFGYSFPRLKLKMLSIRSFGQRAWKLLETSKIDQFFRALLLVVRSSLTWLYFYKWINSDKSFRLLPLVFDMHTSVSPALGPSVTTSSQNFLIQF